jgi:ribosomal protein L23
MIQFSKISAAQVAELFNVSVKTINNWTAVGKRPEGKRFYIKLKKNGTKYHREDIIHFAHATGMYKQVFGPATQTPQPA